MNKLFTLLTFILLIYACNSTSQSKNEEIEEINDEQSSLTISEILDANPKIKVDSVQKRSISQVVNCTGSIKVPPTDILSIHSKIPGIIEYMKYLPGDYVKKGDWLFSISNPDLIEKQRLFLETKAKLAHAEKDYERKKFLLAENATTSKEWEEAEAKLELLSVTYSGLESELQILGVNMEALKNEKKFQPKVNVYATNSGYVLGVFINKGQMIQPETKLMEISNDSHIHLDLQVLSKDASLISKGQMVKFTVPNNGEVLEAKIIKISPVLDDDTGTLMVHCHIDKADKVHIIAGMFVNASIAVENLKFRGLPLDAVVKEGNDYYAFIVKGDYLEKTLLENTRMYNDFITFSGIDYSELMVVSGAYYVE